MKLQEIRGLVGSLGLTQHLTCNRAHSAENTLVTVVWSVYLCRPVSRLCWMSSSNRKSERSSR